MMTLRMDYDVSREINIRIAQTMIARIDPIFEKDRLVTMRPLLDAHGKEFRSHGVEFEYSTPHALPGRCFHNAMQLAQQHELTYCEGLMVMCSHDYGLNFMAHAWCITEDGRVMDPTCHQVQYQNHLSYTGIAFKLSYALAWHSKYGFHGMLDGHPTLGSSVGVYSDPPEMWLAQ